MVTLAQLDTRAGPVKRVHTVMTVMLADRAMMGFRESTDGPEYPAGMRT